MNLLLRTVDTCFHISGICEISLWQFERQRALVRKVTGFGPLLLIALPGLVVVQGFHGARVRHPRQGLCHCYEPNVVSKIYIQRTSGDILQIYNLSKARVFQSLYRFYTSDVGDVILLYIVT